MGWRALAERVEIDACLWHKNRVMLVLLIDHTRGSDLDVIAPADTVFSVALQSTIP